jgi:chemotaxis signal transduction protein
VPDNPTDSQVWDLIFQPGFSTADAVTDLSGRGVGMDVVRRNIQALGGEVQIESSLGAGTRTLIRLPLTLAILDGMTVAVAGETLILPLAYVLEALQPQAEDIRSMAGEGRVLRVRGEYLPILSLSEYYGYGNRAPGSESLVVVVEGDGQKIALEVDELVGQQQVVVKNIENNYRRIGGVSGATILGDGRVALIVDIGGWCVRCGCRRPPDPHSMRVLNRRPSGRRFLFARRSGRGCPSGKGITHPLNSVDAMVSRATTPCKRKPATAHFRAVIPTQPNVICVHKVPPDCAVISQ